MVRGDLSVFPFLSVMQMLLTSGRAGRLNVEHARGGMLWLDRGEVSHAEAAGGLRGEAALQLLASLDGGTFTFEAGLEPPSRTMALRRDAALHRLLDDAEAWKGLLQVFPDLTRTLRFTPRWTPAQPVTRAQYRTLSLLEDGPTILEVLSRSGEPPRAVLDTLRPFVAAGLLEQV